MSAQPPLHSVQYLEALRHTPQNQELYALCFGQEEAFYRVNRDLDTYKSFYFKNQPRPVQIAQRTADQYTDASFPHGRQYPDNLRALTDQTLFYLLELAPSEPGRAAAAEELERRGWRWADGGWAHAARRQRWAQGEVVGE